MEKQPDKRGAGGGDRRDPFDPELPRLLRAARPVQPPADLSALYEQVERSVAAERGARAWLRERSTRMRAAIASSAVAAVAAIALLAFDRPDLGVYPMARMAAVLGVIGAGVALLLFLALRPLQRPAMPAWAMSAGTAGALLALLVVYALPAAHSAHPASLQEPGWLPVVQRALPCLAIGVALGALVYGLLALLDRGGSRRALAMAAAAGLTANLALQLHCPVTAPIHMLLGHLGVAVLLAAAALLLRRPGAR